MGVGRKIQSDVNDPQNAAFYGPAHKGLTPWLDPVANDFTYVSSAWPNDWLSRCAELVQKYHPDIVYFDWWIGQASIRPNLTRFASFYYNPSLKYGDHVGVINYKDYAMQEHAAVLDLERGQLGDIRPFPGRLTLPSATSPGDTSRMTRSSHRNSWSTNSSISSARMAICC